MVEFLLIFALGFLAAALIGMLITPAIYGRIVKLTEKRIQATVPLSAAEIKGKSDLMRAGFASETAKLTTQLEKERENLVAQEWAANKLQGDLATLAGEKSEADQKIAELETQSADMRSEARKQQQLIDKLSGTVTEFERMKRADTEEINRLNNDLMAISTEVESMKIDLATSGTEAVSLRAEINSLEDQRQQLQTEIKAIADTAHDLQQEFKLEQERHNNSRIDLAATQSTLADAEMQLGHANEEIEALQQVNRELKDEAKAIADTAHDLQETLQREQAAHEETRSELTAKQSELVEHQAMLVQSTDNLETQLAQLQTVTESEQLGVKALKETEQRIEALTAELEDTQSALKESRTTLAETEEALADERKGHKNARRELSAKQSALSERQTALEETAEKNQEQLQQLRGLTESERRTSKALKKSEQKVESLAEKLQSTKAALKKSQNSVAELKDKIAGLNASEKQRLKDASIAADRLKDLEVSLLEEKQVDEPPTEEHDHDSAGRERHSGDKQNENRNGSELEAQVGALKDALQKSKEMSGEFRQQLSKMRREVHQLHPVDTVNGNDSLGDDSADGMDEDNTRENGIGRAMQSDPALKNRVEELRARQQALISDLNTGDSKDDDRLREEIADIAALAVGLSAQRGGRLSPVRAMIAENGGSDFRPSGRKSLAERARERVE
ncbi:MAG: hypothetical protein NXI27_09715 [Alphaproteobacteria bacterium]|nr:hypothetical protein [Alphaproteobacteria bacterium]